MVDDYFTRPFISYTCPDCGVEHENRTRNRVCTRCQAQRRKHPCPRCGTPTDHRATHCNRCAPFLNQTLRERGARTHHKPSGYWLVKVPESDPMASMRNAQGYVREHRLVMADHIGRPLTEDEHVHHENHDRGDNRIENLSLMAKADHGSMHMRERWERGEVVIPPALTHCKRGHPYDDENTYVSPTGARQCRACKRERRRMESPPVTHRVRSCSRCGQDQITTRLRGRFVCDDCGGKPLA